MSAASGVDRQRVDDSTARLVEVGTFLVEHRPLWQERPFTGMPLSWEGDHPDVARALRALSEERIDEVEGCPWDLAGMPATYRSWAARARSLSRLSSLEGRPLGVCRPPGVKGRKWEQVSRFVAAVLERRPREVRRWVDWCSGKGHLGRTLSRQSGLPVRCLEARGELCHSGARLATNERVPAEFVEADVLTAPPSIELDGDVGVVALHACGELHVDLLRRAAEAPPAYLALAPCCYHRAREQRPMPLSRAARAAPDPGLERHHARLVGLSEVVAPDRLRRRRRREEAFRLGLDLLLREATGVDEYRPLGPASPSWIEGPFDGFCRSMAERVELPLPRRWDPAVGEARGWERHRLVRALALARGIFRGPIEAWLLLDRAQHLVEAGLEVSLGSFCPRHVTPRNALILACRRGR